MGIASKSAPIATSGLSDPIAPAHRARLDHVDLLRGIIMVLMLLDHTRDYFMNTRVNPTDMANATPALFFTRWITHFCAPSFMLLAGIGAFLRLSRGRTKRELSYFLVTRGVWLIVLEFTLSRWGVSFNLDYHFVWSLVLWALGWAMIALAGLIYLPDWPLATFSIVLIAGHNLFDRVQPTSFGRFGWIWNVLHRPGLIPLSHDRVLLIGYPLVPWIAVMSAGYLLGKILLKRVEQRRCTLLVLGSALIALFVALRALNVYGDPAPWKPQHSLAMTICSFLNCTKYPPSLLFLAMTLGPALLFLAWCDRPLPNWTRPFVTFGRVPMFYYLLNFPIAHALAIAVSAALGLSLEHLLSRTGPVSPSPEWYGFPLWVTYAMWILGNLLLYPLCAWYAGVKKRSTNPLLSYL